MKIINTIWRIGLFALLLSAQIALAQVDGNAPYSTQDHQKEIIGYFTQWDAWKDTKHGVPAKGAYNQLNIDYSQYTILNFSFFGVAKDGTLHSGDLRNKSIYQNGAVQEPGELLHPDIYSSWDYYLLYGELELLYVMTPEAEAAGYIINGNRWSNSQTGLEGDMPIPFPKPGGAPGIIELCKANNVKLMASIGGWSMCKHFPEMARDPQLRANFINDCKTLIDMGFDGIDIDWEYPGNVGMNIENYGPDDYVNFTTMMEEIRAAIGPDKLITAAFSAIPNKLADFEWSKLNNIMDYYNMMSYDYHGGWSNIAGHNSPLYSYEGEEYGAMSWNDTFTYMRDQLGIPAQKITMGVGFYGRGVVTNGAAALNAPTVKTQRTLQPDGPVMTAGDFTNFGDFDATPTYEFIRQKTTDWTYHWDETARVPYLTKGNYFLSFDNEQSISEKAQYVNDHQIGGVIVWQVFGDLEMPAVQTTFGKLPYCPDTKSPLVNTLNQVFAEGDGSPIVNILSPQNQESLTSTPALAAIPLIATASDENGSISSLTFTIAGQELQATLNNNQWTADWTPAAFGNYSLTATAVDNDGETASQQITFSLECEGPDCPNSLPVITAVSPTDGQVIELSELAPVALEFTATDADGTIAASSISVDGQTFTGLQANWLPSAFGNFSISATATDDAGETSELIIQVEVLEVEAYCGDEWTAQVYPAGSKVVFGGFLYEAAWEAAAASQPGSSDVWKLQSACPGTTLNCADYPAYDAATTYQTNGMKVSHQAKVYTFQKWWAVGVEPGTDATTWAYLADCGDVNVDQAPEITFIDPASDLTVVQATFSPIAISFLATDDGSIVTSSLTVDGNTVSGNTYEFTPAAYGAYVVTASATDDAGQTSSAQITITIIDETTNQAPMITSFSPADGTTFEQAALETISIAIEASDPDDNLTEVMIEVDNQSWSSNTAEWMPSAFGTYTITATATDSEGLTVSESHTVTVKASASTGGDCAGIPAYEPYPAIYQTGDIVSHEGERYEALTSNLYNVTPGTADHWWKPLGACEGGDTGGGGTSPTISFVAPQNNEIFNGLVAIEISIEAADDGSITATSIKVDGQSHNGNTYTFNPTAYGFYTITASATDDEGNTSTEEITIRVKDPAAPTAPERVLVGYWHNWNLSSAPYIRLSEVNPMYNVVCIAFAEPKIRDIDNTMVFDPIDLNNQGNEPTEASRQQFKEDVALLQSQGRRVLISIGGANGVVHLDNATEQQKFEDSMVELINQYGFDGLDIDLEGSSLSLNSGDVDFKNPTTPRVVNFINAIKNINARFNNQLIMSSAPETAYVQGGKNAYGGSWGGYLPILHALRDQLDYVHVQLYNTGSVIANDGQIYSQANADFIVAMTEMMLQGFQTQSTAGFFDAFREDQVAIGLPATPAAAPAGGYTAPAEVQKALDYLTKGISFGGNYQLQNPSGYPGLRGWMTWSVNWDAVGNHAYADNFANYYGLANNRQFAESSHALEVYPNPFDHWLSLKNLQAGPAQISLINQQGQSIWQKEVQVQENQLTIDTPEVPAGLYILQIKQEGNQQNIRVLTQ
ncbi:glycosyl hydrolase family 18 protein [Persicobacter diffluens]|uniref:chitinase n=1 Tax=Persicobacter diffluens TaxID=981 RepID=A0AAN4VYY9_9BACT|nr:hypothetical protein PEDI_31760 [Persicobacter diffluens]